MSTEVLVGNENSTDKKSTSGAEDFVSKKAYSEVTADMHKYKDELRNAKAQLNELLERQTLEEREKLEREKKWEELYGQERKAREELKSQIENERKKFLDAHKASALVQELGGLAKQEYIRHANLNAIDVNEDGSVDLNSLKKEADRFKQEHGVLLKNFNIPTLPTQATKQIQKPATEMTFNDKKETIKQALTQIRR